MVTIRVGYSSNGLNCSVKTFKYICSERSSGSISTWTPLARDSTEAGLQRGISLYVVGD
jgi:hypothetical protein